MFSTYLPSSNQYHLHISWVSCWVASANSTIVPWHNHSVSRFWCWPKTRFYCSLLVFVYFCARAHGKCLFVKAIEFIYNSLNMYSRCETFDYWSIIYCHCGRYGVVRLLTTPTRKSSCTITYTDAVVGKSAMAF